MSTGFKYQNFQILHKITEQQLDPEEKNICELEELKKLPRL